MNTPLRAFTPLLLAMVEHPPEAAPETRTITQRCRIGREHGPPHQSDWLLPDHRRTLSRLHCEIVPEDDGWWIVDHGKHGTFVNQPGLNQPGSPVAKPRQMLRDGDRIHLGPYVLEVGQAVVPSSDTVWAGSVSTGLVSTGTEWPAPVGFRSSDAASSGGFELGADWYLEKDAPDSQPLPATHPDPPQPPPIRQDPPRFAHDDRPAAPPIADDLLSAFLRGAALPGFTPDDPARMMEQAGAAMRALVAGLQQVRSSRTALKREFRIADSIYQPSDGRNPLRDFPGQDEALRAMLGGRFDPADAVADMMRRAQLHELALVAAMREAAEQLADTLDPAKAAPADGGLGGIFADRRKARAWEVYQALHRQVREALRDDFDSAFGKAFARAYERVMQQAAGQPG